MIKNMDVSRIGNALMLENFISCGRQHTHTLILVPKVSIIWRFQCIALVFNLIEKHLLIVAYNTNHFGGGGGGGGGGRGIQFPRIFYPPAQYTLSRGWCGSEYDRPCNMTLNMPFSMNLLTQDNLSVMCTHE